MDYNNALNDCYVLLMTRYNELRELETKDKRRGNMIHANQLGTAAFELGAIANKLRQMKQK